MVRELGCLVGTLKENGTAVLLDKQQLAFALKYADRIYIIVKGQVLHPCRPAELASESGIKERCLGV